MGASRNSVDFEYLENEEREISIWLVIQGGKSYKEATLTYMFTQSIRNPSTPFSSQKRMALS